MWPGHKAVIVVVYQMSSEKRCDWLSEVQFYSESGKCGLDSVHSLIFIFYTRQITEKQPLQVPNTHTHTHTHTIRHLLFQ